MAELRSVHMQQSPACHLQGIVSGDAWMIYGMLVLECLKSTRLYSKSTWYSDNASSSVIHSYSSQLSHTHTHTHFVYIITARPSSIVHRNISHCVRYKQHNTQHKISIVQGTLQTGPTQTLTQGQHNTTNHRKLYFTRLFDATS